MPDDTDDLQVDRGPNEDAIRLWLLDMALQHLTRNQGVLGLGAHAVDQSLRAEKEKIVGRLKALGASLEPTEQRRRRA